MKQLFYPVFFTLSFLLISSLHAQSPAGLMGDTAENFYTIKAKMDAYYADTLEGGGLPGAESTDSSGNDTVYEGPGTSYKRWLRFWQDRLSLDRDSTPNSFQGLYRAQREYYRFYTDYCTNSSDFVSNWEHIGPKELKAQRMGRIESVWLDPEDNHHMLAGSNSGGLWESSWNDSLQRFEWTCITDQSHIIAMGVNAIEMDTSKQPRHIWLATGYNSISMYNGYGMGVVYSQDGGQTWAVDDSFLALLDRKKLYYPKAGDIKILPGGEELLAVYENNVLKRYADGHWEIKYTLTNYRHDGSKYPGTVLFDDIAVPPGHRDTIYIGGRDRSGHAGGIKLLRSTDVGENWEIIPTDEIAEQFLTGKRNLDGSTGLNSSHGWANINEGNSSPPWHLSSRPGNPDNKGAVVYPEKNKYSDWLRFNDLEILNKSYSIVKDKEYVLSFYMELPAHCDLEVYLLKVSGSTNTNIDARHFLESYGSMETGRKEITFYVQDRNYNAIAFRSIYNGPDKQASPDSLLIDSLSLLHRTLEVIEVEAPSDTELFIAGNFYTRPQGNIDQEMEKGFVAQLDESSADSIWEIRSFKAPANYFRKHFLVNPVNTNIMYRGLTYRVAWSEDGGQSWDTGHKLPHPDPRDMILAGPTADRLSDTLLIGDDGGVTYSDDGCRSYQNRNGYGLGVNQFYGFANNEQNEKNILAGAQDNGTLRQLHGGDWKHVMGGDGYNTAISPEEKKDQVVFAQSGPGFGQAFIYRDLHHGRRSGFSVAQPAGVKYVAGESPNLRAFDFNKSQHHLFYEGIYKFFITSSYDTLSASKIDWDDLNTNQSQPVRAFEAAPYTQDYYYLAYHWTGATGKLFRKLPSSNDWDDITQATIGDTNLPTGTYPIMDVTCDPDHPERVWVAMGGIRIYDNQDSVKPEKMTLRVLYSPNGGASWHDRSRGLPRFPVTQILYQENSDDILYAGTDVGVYVWNKNLGRWECFSEGLPPILISEMEINYCSGTLRVATFGRGVWETPLPNPRSHAKHITQNSTWNENRNIGNDIVVDAGATLTIEGPYLYNFAPGTRLIVERGGLLKIDEGARLTNRCDNFWEGIEVRGHAGKVSPDSLPALVDAGQYPTGSNDHGVLRMKAGSRIVNAHFGIRNCRVEDYGPELAYSGGLLLIDSVEFLNCWKSLEMWKYQPGKDSASNQYPGYVKDSRFLLDTNYFHVWGNKEFKAFATIWGVEGMRFEYNLFDNGIYGDMDADLRGRGIYGEEAAIHVKGHCTGIDPATGHCTGYEGNEFRNLHTGISLVGSGSAYARLNAGPGNLFYNNVRGIRLSNTRFDRIRSNYFEIPLKDTGLSNLRYPGAIVMTHAKGFRASNNEIQGPAGLDLDDQSMGIRVANSGRIGGEVSHNVINNTRYGIQSEGNNPALGIYCNDFSNQYMSLSINPQSWYDRMLNHTESCQGLWNEFDATCTNSFTHIQSAVKDFRYEENSANPLKAKTSCSVFFFGGQLLYPCNQGGRACVYADSLVSHGTVESLREEINNSPAGDPQRQWMQNELTFMYLELDTTPAMIYGMLEEMHKKDATRSHAMTALSLGDTARSRSILDTMNMKERGDSLFADVVSYAEAAIEAGGTLKDIDSTGRAALYAYAQDTLPEAAWARSHYEIATDEPLRRVEERWTSNKRGPQGKKEEKGYYLGDNIPNPFEGRTRIPYRVPEGAEAVLIISNNEGKIIHQIVLDPKAGSILIKNASWTPGIYYYSLKISGKIVESKKMSIIK